VVIYVKRISVRLVPAPAAWSNSVSQKKKKKKEKKKVGGRSRRLNTHVATQTKREGKDISPSHNHVGKLVVFLKRKKGGVTSVGGKSGRAGLSFLRKKGEEKNLLLTLLTRSTV